MREFDNDKHTHTYACTTYMYACACVSVCQKDYQKKTVENFQNKQQNYKN